MTTILLLTAAVIAALAVHESGHYVAARVLGYPARVVVRWAGPATIWGSDDVISSHRHRFLVAVSGPAANLAVAGAAWAAGVPAVPGLFLLIGVAQLVPFGPSDGSHALKALRGGEASLRGGEAS